MKKIENGFADYYYLDEEGKVYNSQSQKYVRKYVHSYKLRTKEGESRILEYEKIIHNCKEKIRQLKEDAI